MLQFFIAIISAYLIGSIPTGYILSRLTKGIDIREYGSGNVGATNTLRVLGKKMGAAVLLIDIIKGIVAVFALPAIFFNKNLGIALPVFKAFLAFFAVIGHIWTVFLKFKGGKGVATACGVFLAISPISALIGFAIFACTVAYSKYVSLSSIIMAASMPFLLFLFKQPYQYIILSVFMCLLIIYTHRDNIKRLLNGAERKITEKLLAHR